MGKNDPSCIFHGVNCCGRMNDGGNNGGFSWLRSLLKGGIIRVFDRTKKTKRVFGIIATPRISGWQDLP